MDECVYSKRQVCDILGISSFTIANWYRWQKKLIESGEIEREYLPAPEKRENEKGRPCMWSLTMIDQLRRYQEGIVHGRNGIYGRYTDPKKYRDEVSANC